MGTCYKCNDRTVDCHTTCEDYLARYAKNRERDEQRRIEGIIAEVNVRSVEKTMGKRVPQA